ncbi:MAG: DUF3656 domain-containing protein [Myxococcota bacterium]
MRAAVRAGADAVYFGLQAFNARARATNFDSAGLRKVMHELHAWGVKGYVALNTLVFDHELAALEEAVRACACAGVDAVIVQDLGTARLCHAVAPGLPIHASTQMTCTDAGSVELAAEMGARRVVLARELSLDEIARIRASTGTELEVFVHGALCVSYSGQCLTSEAIGGRSANRGACAQACRLPYELVVDGQVKDLGERAHLLSPGDLESSHLVGRMAELGISSLKIEGRLKSPDYVAAVTRLYRAAVDETDVPRETLRREALITYSRGSGPGFLEGVNHQVLVEGRTCEHRGLLAGEVESVVNIRGKPWLRLTSREPLARGDGLMVEGGRAGAGETGGRIWDLLVDGEAVARVDPGVEALVWMGPDTDVRGVVVGRRVFLNGVNNLEARILEMVERAPHREPVDMVIRGAVGNPFTLEAHSARGLEASVTSDTPVQSAEGRPTEVSVLREKLGRLGDTPYVLRELRNELANDAMVPVSALNRARRGLADALRASGSRSHATTDVTAKKLLDAVRMDDRTPPPAGLFVLCRTLEQAVAAHQAGADGIYLDFLALTGMSRAMEQLRAMGVPFVGVAPPRIRKPGEEKIDRFLTSLEPDAFLVRGLGALREGAMTPPEPGPRRALRIGDFSLNITNRLSAAEVLKRNLDAFTPSFDLDSAQLSALLSTSVGPFAELVVHHPMPLFHMEHCLFAALLSEGRDYRTCGRPCEQHVVSLRDRVGLDNPVEADIGCRNTVFHAKPQSAAGQVPGAVRAGCRRFRVELVREKPSDVERIVRAYQSLIAGRTTPAEVFRTLSTEEGYGVVRGSLRVLG